MQKGQKGFTLIELLVVVTIIGILAAAAIPKLMKAMDKARLGRCNSDIAAVKSAAMMYSMDKGYYPSAAGGLTTEYISTVPEGGAASGPALVVTWATTASTEYAITCPVTKSGCMAMFSSTAGTVTTSGGGCP